MDLKEMAQDVALINLVQDTSQRWYLVNTVLALRVTCTVGNYLAN